jgi:hypothetical protein
MLLNAASGCVRSVFPYYAAFRSEAVASAVQRRFPYRSVYHYPYLVGALSSGEVIVIALGVLVAALAGGPLLVRGALRTVRDRDFSLAILLAAIPQAAFFCWWLGLSDEFWIWSMPILAVLAARGAAGLPANAAAGRGSAGWLLTACASGLAVATGLGAVQPLSDGSRDVDRTNQSYLSRLGPADLQVSIDEIQSTGRVGLAAQHQHFKSFNIFFRASRWTAGDLAALDADIAATLIAGGKVFVDPYVLHPPRSRVEWIKRTASPEFDAQRAEVIRRLQRVDPARIEWLPLVARVPGYFVE